MAASTSSASSPALPNLRDTKAILSTAASMAATIMLARSLAQDFIPRELQGALVFRIRKFLSHFSSQLTMVVDESDGLVSNQIYDAAQTYLASKVSSSTQRLNVSKPDNETQIHVRMESREEVCDEFRGVKFKWVLISRRMQSSFSQGNRGPMGSAFPSELRSFGVSFHKQHKEMALQSYFPHIVSEAKSIKEKSKTPKLFTLQNLYGNNSDTWAGVNLDHPATFDTLAMNTELKNTILNDLQRFARRKDYYRRVGKAWKRGYLLYGPPGTGKSSLIAAMASYLRYDVYDLELTELRGNSELRRLLIATPNRSILVVEDIDCTIDFGEQSAEPDSGYCQQGGGMQMTLSGLLNFIDGLWSSCGDERIIVFTTNHKEKLDPALLRPGRMDVHINLSYCTPCGFRILASNYLGLDDHSLFREIEELISTSEVTPAEVAEQLMRNDDEADCEGVLVGLIEFLRFKKEKAGEVEEIGDQNEEEFVGTVAGNRSNNFRGRGGRRGRGITRRLN
ncbi:unnamed protein product [Linum tenue]|uniref:AAA+ ATPase domain-containing protein n=1 Tax=Linum tenue TaxID=586396 RepID=A0AAV0GU04_9ROSI|nr:unnamed protein product [Linum tenue]